MSKTKIEKSRKNVKKEIKEKKSLNNVRKKKKSEKCPQNVKKKKKKSNKFSQKMSPKKVWKMSVIM